ncbi:MAG: class I SAM-dependent methyltransferase [Chloroflexi bacterium]|nr:class I SAM-dependent methyltransferase [Chloroflexota bacterium]
MDHADHVNLIGPAVLEPGGSWADLGAGSGAFTLALREALGLATTIHAVDKDKLSLEQLERAYQTRFGSADHLQIQAGDFSRSIQLPALDGIIAANSLRYFKDRVKILQHIKSFLKPNGKLIVIKCNVDSGNPWAPYPFTFQTFGKLAKQAGFSEPRLLAVHPSRFLREFYSALTFNITRHT